MCAAFARAQIHADKEDADIRGFPEVTLMVPDRKTFSADPFAYYGVERNFSIEKIPVWDAVKFGRIGFLLESFLFLSRAAKRAQKEKGALVYSREEALGFFCKGFALELHTLPKRAGFFRRLLWSQTRALFVLTSLMKDELRAQGIDEEKIFVLPDAVDAARFGIPVSKEEARRKLNLPIDKKIVLYSGSFFLYGWKGVDSLLETAELFQGEKSSIFNYPLSKGNEILFVFVGGSTDEIAEAKKNRTTLNALFIGRKPHTEIPYYLKAADVLVLPNKSGDEMSERHTSPLKLFEYLASSRPVVCSDLPSLREVVGEQEVFFFKPNSPQDLARAIADALGDDSLASARAESARRKASNYTWDKRAKRVLDKLLI